MDGAAQCCRFCSRWMMLRSAAAFAVDGWMMLRSAAAAQRNIEKIRGEVASQIPSLNIS